MSADNYEIARSLLHDRYNNTRLIVSNHVKSLFNQPSIGKESAAQLRELLNNTNRHLKALEVLKLPVQQWDTLVIHIITEKLDAITIREWELASPSRELPLLKELMLFLEKRCRALEVLKPREKIGRTHQGETAQRRMISHQTSHVATHGAGCPMCKLDHFIYQCTQFRSLTPGQRIRKARAWQICYNCLKSGHEANDCRSGGCKLCKAKHNTLLHNEPQTSNQHETSQEAITTQAVQHTINHSYNSSRAQSQVLLSTAIVLIRDDSGATQKARVLLDSGSQSSFVTETMVQRLKLKRSRNATPIAGINQHVTGVSHSTSCTIMSMVSDYKVKLDCLILPKITGRLPSNHIDTSNWHIPPNFQLADEGFALPNKIDLLIGAEVYFDLLCGSEYNLGAGLPTMHDSHLGWIVAGRIDTAGVHQPSNYSHLITAVQPLSIDEQLLRFWTIEELSNPGLRTPEENACEAHFDDTTRRDVDGRYIVRLPFHKGLSLGNSCKRAEHRFLMLERRLAKNPEMSQEYHRFMSEYKDLGHMTLIPTSLARDQPSTYYLPHHPILRPSSATTKLRVVFDASAKSTNGLSLNDILLTGPTVQQELVSIIMRFRTFPIVLTADIEKMYRQIRVDPRDADWQRIIWRQDERSPLQHYKLNTVTYGTTSAPYLATRCLQQLALDEHTRFPQAAAIIARDFYVDDLLTGASSMEEAVQIRDQLIHILKKGGFCLRKWCSNRTELLTSIPDQDKGTNLTVELKGTTSVKTLGLLWQPSLDTFQFRVQEREESRLTKRDILSMIACIFDPLGLLGPIIVKAKMFMQQLWQIKLGWDEEVPASFQATWSKFYSQLLAINDLEVPRGVIDELDMVSVELHGFSDASERAYGACIYIYSINKEGHKSSKLLCSKSRVSPLKQISLPRLELSGALLLSRLLKRVLASLNIKLDNIHLWTDSTIVLAWIKSMPTRWKTFVANRVSEIQELTVGAIWHHIPSECNPADLVSRGIDSRALCINQLWWAGPTNLMENASVVRPSIEESTELPEQRVTIPVCVTVVMEERLNIFEKYSDMYMLQRVLAYCLRFLNNVQHKKKLTGGLSRLELDGAMTKLLIMAQGEGFCQEISELRKKGTVEKNGRLSALCPFLDGIGLLRVGGRLQLSGLPYDSRHPILLPNGHRLTDLVILQEHLRLLHCGPQLLLASLRKRYWLLNGRSAVRKRIHRCIKCFRLRATSAQQLMGSLPSQRVEPARAFLHCGVDYAGPILTVPPVKTRQRITIKSYIAVFICFTTKAIHLELVGDLTTQAFLAAFRRFISRRGYCRTMYSDNATTFKGANHELHDMYKLIKSNQGYITRELSKVGVEWKFIPPIAPHFGGLWEGGVKAVKYHLKRIVSNSLLNFEELYTFLVQIEACLNSRPLLPLSSDPSDLSVLTPGHFLIGELMTAIPEPDLTVLKINRLSRWQRIQQLTQHFWKRWSEEYLGQLQQRSRWRTPCSNIQPDTMVILKEDNQPPLQWRLGRVVSTHPGQDGLVRVVTIRTQAGLVKRPVSRVCILPVQDDGKSVETHALKVGGM